MNANAPLVSLHAVVGLSAIGGAVYALRGAPNVPAQWLEDSPFRSYAVPGALLGTVVAGSQLTAAVLVAEESRFARRASLAASATLAAWIGAQVSVIGLRSPLQPLMAGVAFGTAWLAGRQGR